MPVDSSVMPAAIVLLVIGGMTLVNWGFAMFSDHWYADLVRQWAVRPALDRMLTPGQV